MSPVDAFLRPAAAPLLLAAPLAWLALRALEGGRARRLAALAGPRAAALAPAHAPALRGARRALFAAGVLLAATALLEPAWGRGPAGAGRRGADIVVALDVSRSMLARDVAPDRLARARAMTAALAEAARGDRLGLVVFAGEARLRAPLTADRATFASLAAGADPFVVERGGTDLGAALDLAAATLAAGGGERGTVLLVTDGGDLGGGGLRAAERCRARGIVVHVVALGTAGGAKIPVASGSGGGEAFLVGPDGREVVTAVDLASLRRLASAGGGTCIDGTAVASPLVDLYRAHVLPVLDAAAREADRRARPRRHGAFLAAAFALLLADFVLGAGPARRVRRAIGITPPRAAPRSRRGGAPGDAGARTPAARSAAGMAAAVVPALLAGCAPLPEPGAAAHAGGRYADAVREIRAAIDGAGEAAPPRLHLRLALAALAARDVPLAESAAERAAATAAGSDGALARFVLGNVAWARCDDAERDTFRAGPDPSAFDRAIALAERALDAWAAAATADPGLDGARRNAERAALRVRRLRADRERADRERGSMPGARGEPRIVGAPTEEPSETTPPPGEGPGDPAELPAAGAVAGTTPDLAAILERLGALDRERDERRRARREATGGGAERDW